MRRELLLRILWFFFGFFRISREIPLIVITQILYILSRNLNILQQVSRHRMHGLCNGGVSTSSDTESHYNQ